MRITKNYVARRRAGTQTGRRLRHCSLPVCAPYLGVICLSVSSVLLLAEVVPMNHQNEHKSYLVQLILNIIFGPLGLFYSSKLYGIVFSITILPTIMVFGFGIIVGWPISIIVGITAVGDYNRQRSLSRLKYKSVKSGT